MKIKLLTLLLSCAITSIVFAEKDYTIHVKSGEFTPQKIENSGSIKTNSLESSSHVYRIVQFYDIPSTEKRDELHALGMSFLGYIPSNAYITKLPANISNSQLIDKGVRSVFQFTATQKLSKLLKAEQLPAWAVKGNKIELVIAAYDLAVYPQIVNYISTINGEITLNKPENYGYITATVKISDINKIASHPYVSQVEPIDPPAEKEDTEGRSLHRSSTISNNLSAGRKYDGTGMVISLADDGAIGPHIDWEGRFDQTGVPASSGTHGDMTTGIMGGAGNIDPTVVGMAPGAYMYYYDIGGYPQVNNAISNYNNYGTMLSSTSYSQGTGGVYNSSASSIDNQIHNNSQLIHVFSAGNAGNSDHGYGAGAGWGNITGGYKAAKSVITCGNLNQYDVLWSSSSRGPADDGRIKPDICSYGNSQMSTDENYTYSPGGGTSAAAPGIAGITTQLYHAYRENNGGADPESGFIKACMLNTAEDLGNPGPDFQHGWGRINALKAVRIIEDSTYFFGNITNGGSASHNITVPANVGQLRVMTYWIDEPGSASASFALVNDIDMQVVDPSSSVFNPWVLDPTPNASILNGNAVRGLDHLNNMEQVTIDNPAAGTYTVNLNGYNVPMGPQNYYIVYDFIYDDIEVVYPLGSERIAPNETQVVRWDAYGTTGSFTMQYSVTGGATWTTVSTSISGSARYFNWNVPSILTGNAKVRISRSGQSDQSEVFSIVGVPSGLSVTSVCADTIQLDWNPVSGISEYEVSMLGNKYMDSIARVSATTIKIPGLNANEEHWFSVRAIFPSLGIDGRRAYAVRQMPGVSNCIYSNNLAIEEVIAPYSGEIPNCLGLTSTEIVVKVKNIGTNAISTADLAYQVNGGTINTEGFTLNLNQNNSATITFAAPVDLSTAGSYEVKIFSSWPTDQDRTNDTIVANVEVYDANMATMPFMEDFEDFTSCATSGTCGTEICNLDNGWFNSTNGEGDDINWRIDEGGTPTTSSGPEVDHTLGTVDGKYIYIEVPTSCYEKEAVLNSPCIDLTNAAFGKLNFAVHMDGATMGRLHFDVLTKDGIDINLRPAFSQQFGDDWVDTAVDLSAYFGEIIVFQFRGVTGNGPFSDIALDDIQIRVSNTATSELLNSKFTISPNPTTGLLNINIDDDLLPQIQGVSISNVLGQQEMELNRSEMNESFQLDISQLASGVHYFTIYTTSGVVVEKIVKE